MSDSRALPLGAFLSPGHLTTRLSEVRLLELSSRYDTTGHSAFGRRVASEVSTGLTFEEAYPDAETLGGLLEAIKQAFLDGLHDLLARGTCTKLIQYQANSVSFSGLGAKLGPVDFSLGKFGRDTRRLREATELALTLDDYQYNLCNISQGLRRTDPYWRKLLERRVAVVTLITSVRVTMAADGTKSPSRKKTLDDLLTKLTYFSGAILDESIPHLLPSNVMDEAVSDTFRYAGIAPGEVSRIFDLIASTG